MAQNIEIRKATTLDATGMAVVLAYTWLTAYRGLMPDDLLESRIAGVPDNAARLKNLIKQGRADYAVAVQDNAVIGVVSYGQSRNADFPGGEINALYVLKAFAGKGCGRALFRFAVNELKSKGYTSMIINCLDGNPSIDFYRHMGGRVAGNRQDDVFGYTIKENILQFEI